MGGCVDKCVTCFGLTEEVSSVLPRLFLFPPMVGIDFQSCARGALSWQSVRLQCHPQSLSVLGEVKCPTYVIGKEICHQLGNS